MSSSIPPPILPEGFEYLDDINGMPSARLDSKPLVNIFGIITSHRPPLRTRNTDWKCEIEIIDNTFPSPSSRLGMKANFFYPREKLPNINGVDVIILEKIRVQLRNGRVSLLTNFATKFYVLAASDFEKADTPSAKISMAFKYQISEKYMSYATWLYQTTKSNGDLPSTNEFLVQTEQAASFKDKYSQLKDLKADQWYDLLGEVIQIYEGDGRATMYLSDYTKHPLFFDQKWIGTEPESYDRDGDEFGYTAAFIRQRDQKWPGPYGKLSIQLTLYDEHVSSAREVKIGQWVNARNVQVKMGRDGQNLEGFLRGTKGGINALSKFESPGEVDPRYKDALYRRKAYEENFKAYSQGGDNMARHGSKRKLDPKSNSRKKKKLAAAKKLAEEKAADEKLMTLKGENNERLALNRYIKCNNPSQATRLLSEWLDPEYYVSKDEGVNGPLPFVNRNFRANTRVIDFFPDRLEDFTVGRVVSDYDILSDHESGTDSDAGDEIRGLRQTKEWKWQFALKLEDGNVSDDSKPKGKLWALVDHNDAQFLLGLDADNLRENGELLTQLRRQLEILWGDLEERKLAVMEKLEQLSSTLSKPTISTQNEKKATWNSTSELSSSDENTLKLALSRNKNQPLTDRDINLQSATTQETKESILEAFQRDPQVKNKVFTCCIHEYGIKNKDTGKITDRKFGMFETKIVGDE